MKGSGLMKEMGSCLPRGWSKIQGQRPGLSCDIFDQCHIRVDSLKSVSKALLHTQDVCITVNLGINSNMLLISKPGLGTAYLLPMTGHIEVVVNLPSGKFYTR